VETSVHFGLAMCSKSPGLPLSRMTVNLREIFEFQWLAGFVAQQHQPAVLHATITLAKARVQSSACDASAKPVIPASAGMTECMAQ